VRIRIVAVGQKMPAWVSEGYDEYARRIQGDCRLELVEVPMAKRGKGSTPQLYREKEAAAIFEQLKPSDLLVALDVEGKSFSTEDLCETWKKWQREGRDIVLAIGGPDGLDEEVLRRAESKLSLSRLTLPHPLVRVILAEQLYRAWSILQGHPYHR
jgi:23S rRNA (pseudouridine1915-N3)-methyltransferase